MSGPFLLVTLAIALVACQFGSSTPTPAITATQSQITSVASPTATFPPTRAELFRTYAGGELLPDMRVPIQRSESGEGGWYTIIGTEEGWAQFLSQMGQPAEIWEPVTWSQEILIGALLGVRSGRGHAVTISDVQSVGIDVQITISTTVPQAGGTPSPWIAYPFHFVRVPRDELPLGPVTFEFLAADDVPTMGGQPLVSQEVDMTDLNILWLPGEAARYPTPTPPPSTSTPEPARTPTPVPNQQSKGTVLEVIPDALTLRLLPQQGEWAYVELMEATSILSQDGQPATAAQLLPGTTISILGYEGEGGTLRAAHIDILGRPVQTQAFPYRSRDASLSTLYSGYSLPLSTASISTTIPLSQTFSLTQTRVLTENGFLVVPATYASYRAAYGDPRGAGHPTFVSMDSVLQTTQQSWSLAFRSVEEDHLLPELRMLEREMFTLSWSQYKETEASNTPAEQRIATTALRNAAYFAVPLSLLDPEFELPDVISTVVEAELSLITASSEITTSPLMDLPGVPDDDKLSVDYGQFSPTGHYAVHDHLANYYRALTWHRAIAFRTSQREETRSAALIAYAMNSQPAARILWERIVSVLGYFQGQDASYTPAQYSSLLGQIWNERFDLTSLADEEGLDALTNAIEGLPQPNNPIWTFWSTAETAPARDWRFLSAPFWVDTYVFEQMTGDQVGDQETPRALPSYVDLSAVLGSLESYRIAGELGATEYADYLTQIGKVRNELSALQLGHWTADLHAACLYADRSLVQEKTPSYPEWMRTASWRRKELQSVYGKWTVVRATFGAESASVLGEEQASEGAPVSAWGYVEPQPETYARLAAITRQAIDGLEGRLMLSAAEQSALLEMETWLIFLQDVARRELTGQALLPEEYERLGEYAALLQALSPADEEDIRTAVLIAAADAGQLVEATGWIDEVYVVVDRGQQRFLARGAVYSHYEFIGPLEEPVTVTRWQEMIESGKQPPRPLWVASFVVE